MSSIESGVVPVSLYQVRVYTVLDDASVLQYQYAISILHRGQAVRNDEGGSLRQQSVQRFLHSPLGSRIYTGCSFIQDEDGGSGEESARVCHELTFPCREAHTTLAYNLSLIHISEPTRLRRI